jgi:hypothetical protein
VFWSDIGGNKEIIETIRRNIEWPLKNPQAFKRLGITPPNVSNKFILKYLFKNILNCMPIYVYALFFLFLYFYREFSCMVLLDVVRL